MELYDDDQIPVSPPSLKSKIKHSLCFYCCFRRHHHDGHSQVLDSSPGQRQPPSDEKPTLLWTKSRTTHDLKDEIKDKCMTVFAGGKHKRHGSAEFSYDPLSYALNFEDGFDDDDEYPLRNFSARLPRTSPQQPVKTLPTTVREITAVT